MCIIQLRCFYFKNELSCCVFSVLVLRLLFFSRTQINCFLTQCFHCGGRNTAAYEWDNLFSDIGLSVYFSATWIKNTELCTTDKDKTVWNPGVFLQKSNFPSLLILVLSLKLTILLLLIFTVSIAADSVSLLGHRESEIFSWLLLFLGRFRGPAWTL